MGCGFVDGNMKYSVLALKKNLELKLKVVRQQEKVTP